MSEDEVVKAYEDMGYCVYSDYIDGYRTHYYYDGDNPIVIWTNYNK